MSWVADYLACGLAAPECRFARLVAMGVGEGCVSDTDFLLNLLKEVVVGRRAEPVKSELGAKMGLRQLTE